MNEEGKLIIHNCSMCQEHVATVMRRTANIYISLAGPVAESGYARYFCKECFEQEFRAEQALIAGYNKESL